MRKPVWIAAAIVAFACPAMRGDVRPARPPNVVVILADDLGFSDLGCHGGEIDTPHLDRLAAGGLRFTQGYSTARCWPSRAALLTGYYPQAIRRDALPGGKGGAQGRRPEWARLLPELLAPAGYRSYHSGKWHVDGDPLKNGFARSLDANAAGQDNYFDAAGLAAAGRPVADRAGFYATAAIGDHAVECLAEHARDHAGKPFFHYVAFTAPHFPLQAPADLVAKYRERYRAGWEKVRGERCRRVRELGIVTTPAAQPEPDVGPPYQPSAETLARLGPGEVDRPRPWETLTAEQREFQADKMAIHAAMVEALDRAVGRIVAQLEAMQALDDTLILFASDNGASAEIMIRGEGHDPAAEPGSRQTFLCLGPGWSTCANAPFRRHKTWVHEGGIATPWIVHWPKGVAARGDLRRQPVHLVDVAPTVLELAGVAPPQTIGGVAVPPMQGRSFAAALPDATAKPAHETLWWCHEGHRAVRAGDWKLVSARGRPWELYDLAADRCETTDLAAREPERVRDLEAKWNATAAECRALAAGERPNVVVILIDDLGYGDIGPFGATKQRTPRLDRMAAEGMKLTSFYAAPACSVSRAQLLTGCYGVRVSVPWVFFPAGPQGLAPAEVTLAERLRDLGYATACVGKWHLGDQPEFLPTRQGFDTYFGIPYSNDMQRAAAESGTRVVPLLRDEKVEALLTDEEQREIVARYTEEAVDFIRANRDKPFFLYLPHTAVHAPLFPGRAVAGKSGNGAFGDWVEEVDWSVGKVLDALAECGVDERTLVIFTSDNGPWPSVVGEATSAGPLRGSKGSTWEGGVRVPTIARWPGRIAAGSACDAMAGNIDLVPTCVALAGGRVPEEPVIDGRDISGLLLGTSTEPARDTQAYFMGTDLQAVRQGRWKLVVAPQRDGMGRKGEAVPASFEVPRLYDLVADVGERTDVAADHPDVVERIRGIARAVAAELAGDDPPGRRPPGAVANPTTIYPTRPEPEPAKKPAAAPAPAAARPSAGRRPNIIYVMTDDQGYGDIAAHGNPVIRTPHLDRLHGASVRLTEFHVSPTCSPTRAALMTGRHEFRSGVTHTIHERERLALSATTLPQLLQASGYTTGIFGKWHLGDEDAWQPGKRGFDRVFIHGAGGIGQSYPGSCGDVPGNSYFDPVIRSDGEFVKTKGYCTDVFFTAALDWIDRCRTQEKPFFCYLTPNAPHGPLDCPPESDAPYLDPLEAAGITDLKERARIAKFYGMIGNIDTNLGRLLAKLDEWGLAENTLVVFTTDNGTATGARVSNDGMRGQKGTPFRGGTRVPSFWRWKGSLPEGMDVPAVIAHIDVLPTLCEIAGVEIPAPVATKVEGRSFAPLLRGARIAWPDRPLVTHVGRWDRGQAAESAYRNCRIREGRWSLVNTRNRPDTWELFDLAADPGEQTDVAKEHPDLVARLAATYDEWWRSVLPDLSNEEAVGPPENPYAVAWRGQGGGAAAAAPSP